jgi:bis(5'-adenosyl)-triphosphatase
VEGHVLVCPVREVERYCDLSPVETIELFVAAKQIGKILQKHYKTQSISYAIQDGKYAGDFFCHLIWIFV